MADYKQLDYGLMISGAGANYGYGSFTLDQATDALEFIFQAVNAVTITRLGYRVNAITGTSPVFRISLQGVGSTGTPDGTIKGGGAPAQATFTPAAAPNWTWVNLDNPYTCARGEFLAIVIARDSGTIDGSNNVAFSSVHNTHGTIDLPYSINNNNGTRARQLNVPVFGYGSVGTAYGRPSAAITNTGFGSTSTPDEYAIAFNLPATIVSTYQVLGALLPLLTPAIGSTVKVLLYEGTTVLQDVTWDTDVGGTSGGTVAYLQLIFDEVTPATLAAGTTYRLAVQPQDTTTLALPRISVAAAADFEAWPGGQNFWVSTRTNAGAWTDTPTQRLVGGLIITDWTVPIPAAGPHTFTPLGSGRMPVF